MADRAKNELVMEEPDFRAGKIMVYNKETGEAKSVFRCDAREYVRTKKWTTQVGLLSPEAREKLQRRKQAKTRQAMEDADAAIAGEGRNTADPLLADMAIGDAGDPNVDSEPMTNEPLPGGDPRETNNAGEGGNAPGGQGGDVSNDDVVLENGGDPRSVD